MEFEFRVGKKEIFEKWSEQASPDEWIEMYEKLSVNHMDWSSDMRLAEYIVNKVKEGYIDEYMDEDIPDVLRPLLIQAIGMDINSKNESNKDITLEEVSGEEELEAIRILRGYSIIDYEDAINIFCKGYEFAKDEASVSGIMDLSEIETKALMCELQKRIN